MADYNVQMKQYNGTSFDNILPYASQALTLAGGGGATEIIAQARAGLSQIAAGSYVGNDQLNLNIEIGFKPKFIIVQQSDSYSGSPGQTQDEPVNKYLTASFVAGGYSSMCWMNGLEETVVYSAIVNRHKYYVTQHWTIGDTNINVSLEYESTISSKVKPSMICNVSSVKYSWIAFG